MFRGEVLSDDLSERLEPLLPPLKGSMGRPMTPHRPVIEGLIYRYRTSVPWRDLPEQFGPWQTVWKRHNKLSKDGTWDRVLTALQAQADAAGQIDWAVSVDSTIARAHQHATNMAPGRAQLAHRGLGRMTRIRGGAGTNRTITPSAGRAAA